MGALPSAWASARLDGGVTGAMRLRQALAGYIDQGNKTFVPFYQAQGDSEGALTRIDEALALARENGEHWSDAFLHRLRGEILLKRDPMSTAAAEDAFLTAIAVSQQQNARSFELRAAFSLAKLYHSTDRPPMPMPYSRLRSRAFRRPRNFPRLNKRKCSSQRWRHEPIEGAGDFPFLAQIWPLLGRTVRRP
jgi:hypothetical protein